MNKTALHERHRQLGARMVNFHDWEMPLYYTSILEEHKAVRQALGIFDISHMGQVIVDGSNAVSVLNHLMVSDINQVGCGRACYTLMLNESGGIIDDLIVYRIGEERYLVIVNCANRATDVDWITAHRSGKVNVTNISDGRSMLAVQGPSACHVLERILSMKIASLGRFDIVPISTVGGDAYVARTGYTGSDGFEIFLPDSKALWLWDKVLNDAKSNGVLPVGLGARDTLRVEAGLRLYGTDMDQTTTPFEAGLSWTVAIGKEGFIGQDALKKQKQQAPSRVFVGFELSQGPVPRMGNELTVDGRKIGSVTSGTFSPLLNKPLGMGYVETAYAKPKTVLTLTVRSFRYTANVVKLPFWTRQIQEGVVSKATLQK